MQEIFITYRRTSRLSMRIGRGGEVRVSVPYGVARAEVERFIDEHRDWIGEALARAAEQRQQRADFYGRLPLATRRERAEAVERLDAIIQPMVDRNSAAMGVRPSAVSYRATTSRWGCCNIKTSALQFSLYLLLLPEWCVESVVVHELAHLIVPNHSPRFHAVLDRHFPRWREARREIKRVTSC